MKRDLLLDIASRVEQLEPGRFYFGSWVGHDWRGAPDLSCGTTACVGGWVTVWFPELGLELRKARTAPITEGGITGIFLVHKSLPADAYASVQTSIDALAVAFDILPEDARHLFIPRDYGDLDGDASPQRVAEHIRAFVASKEENMP